MKVEDKNRLKEQPTQTEYEVWLIARLEEEAAETKRLQRVVDEIAVDGLAHSLDEQRKTAEARCRELEDVLRVEREHYASLSADAKALQIQLNEANAHLAWARKDGKWYESRVRELGKMVKTTVGRVIAEWSARAVMKVPQLTLVETVFAAVDAALAASAPGKKEESRDG